MRVDIPRKTAQALASCTAGREDARTGPTRWAGRWPATADHPPSLTVVETQSSRSPSEGEEEEEDRHTDLSLIASIASATGDATPLAAAAREYRIRARSTIDEMVFRIRSLKTLQWERNPSLQGSVQGPRITISLRTMPANGASSRSVEIAGRLTLAETLRARSWLRPRWWITAH